MFVTQFNHPIKEIELTLQCIDVELIKISSTNVITKDTNIVWQLVTVNRFVKLWHHTSTIIQWQLATSNTCSIPQFHLYHSKCSVFRNKDPLMFSSVPSSQVNQFAQKYVFIADRMLIINTWKQLTCLLNLICYWWCNRAISKWVDPILRFSME